MERILVLAPNKPFLGAQIVQIPFLSELRVRHPDCRIELAVPFSGTTVFEQFGFHDELVLGWGESPGRTLGFLARCTSGRYDRVYSLRAHSSRAGLAALLSGARTRVGFDLPGNGFFFNRRVAPRDAVYLALKYLDLLEPTPRQDLPAVSLWSTETEFEMTALLVERGIDGPLVGFVVGAGAEKKRWPVSRFLELRRLVSTGFPDHSVLFFLSAEEADGEIGAGLGDVDRRFVFVLDGIRTLACAFARCRALVSTDCGPAHLGHLLGIPQVVLFDGSGKPHEWFRPRPAAAYLIAGKGDTVERIRPEPVFDELWEVLRARGV